MLLSKTCLIAMMFVSPVIGEQQKIVVIGEARNAKAGAVVVSTKNQKMYYIDQLAAWDRWVVGRTVRVSGTMLLETGLSEGPNAPLVQEMIGERRVIVKANWKLLR